MYSSFIIHLNGLDIIFTLNIYFEYIKLLHKILVKYTMPILQVYQTYFIIILKIITNHIYNYLHYIIFKIFTNYIY